MGRLLILSAGETVPNCTGGDVGQQQTGDELALLSYLEIENVKAKRGIHDDGSLPFVQG